MIADILEAGKPADQPGDQDDGEGVSGFDGAEPEEREETIHRDCGPRALGGPLGPAGSRDPIG